MPINFENTMPKVPTFCSMWFNGKVRQTIDTFLSRSHFTLDVLSDINHLEQYGELNGAIFILKM